MDPYIKILNSMQRQGKKFNPPSICTGTVTSPPPNLIIKVNDMPLYNDDILISDYLLSDYSRNISSNITDATISQITTIDSVLNEGDKVAIMPTIDMQTWIVLCKVVHL
jgi:hypothetical protein